MKPQYLFAIAIAVLALIQSVFVVDETELAIVTEFGKFKRSITTPGLNFKTPFVQQVDKMERRILGTDTPPDEYLTLDKKRILADPITRWRIEDPLKFYITMRDEIGAKRRVDDIVKSELRRELASRDFADIVGNARDPMMKLITERSRDQTREFGVMIVDVRIKRADLPKQVQESVFARMRAEREREAKRYRSEGEEEAAKIRADSDKEKTIILARAYEESQKLRGEGDAVSTKIYAEAFGADEEFYTFLRSLETYEASVGPGSTVVLSTGSDLFKYLTSPRR